MKEMENGYICEVLDFLLRKRYGAPLVLLSVDLVEVDNEASLRLLCALFKHCECSHEDFYACITQNFLGSCTYVAIWEEVR